MLGKRKARGELLEKKANNHKNAQLRARVSSSASHSEQWKGEGSSYLGEYSVVPVGSYPWIDVTSERKWSEK